MKNEGKSKEIKKIKDRNCLTYSECNIGYYYLGGLYWLREQLYI